MSYAKERDTLLKKSNLILLIISKGINNYKSRLIIPNF